MTAEFQARKQEILKKLYSHHLSLVAYLLDGRAPDPKFSENVMLAEASQALDKHYSEEFIKLSESITSEMGYIDLVELRDAVTKKWGK